ncbi:MAG: non-ribosomal peptide synthetase, partial [Acidobacteria bacterium]|nr:non-ribosomal peptide synthetase [Acidobacteriota bacterium]
QVKIRGFRLEPGEVEAALELHPALGAAVAMVREDVPGDRRLVAYLVPRGGAAVPAPRELRDFLSARLPAHAVPQAFVPLEALPLTRNGKLDREALPAPATCEAEPAAALSGPFEELLAGIWCEVLGVERVAADDDFFERGGHSLQGTRVLARISAALGVELPLHKLFERPTLRGLAAELGGAGEPGEPGERPPPPLVPLPPEQERPLSFAQERLWFLDQLAPGSALYNMPAALELRGELAPATLARALACVRRRHEVLRSRFVASAAGPLLRRAAPGGPALPQVDLAALPATARQAEARRLAWQEARRPFDLARGPLLRATLLRLAPRRHRALVTLHHIASDGASMELLYGEVVELYAALASGLPCPLAELPVQYADFAAWQRSCLAGEPLERQLAHWRRRLDGASLVLELPADRARPPVASSRGGTVARLLAAPLAAELRQLAHRQGSTLFMLVLAGWQALLSRYTGRVDFLLGTPVSTRERVETEALIGPFVNTLVLRADLAGDPELATLVGRCRETTLEAHRHRGLPFERLVEELQPARDMSRNALVQVLLSVEGPAPGPRSAAGLALIPKALPAGSAKFDLSLAVAAAPPGLVARLEYASDLFDAATAARALGHLQTLLGAAVAEPRTRLSQLPLLGDGEQAQLLREWSDSALAAPAAECLHHLFEEQARRSPERVALVAGEERLSYGELNR